MDAVSQIKQKLDIVDVIAGYLSLKKAGKNYKSACPFHSDDTPSFIVSPDIQRYKCFGCGETGDMFNFVQKMEGVDFIDALERLAEKAGVTIEKKEYDPSVSKKASILKINEISTDFYHHLLTVHPIGKKAMEYLMSKRKLTKETIKAFRLGYAPDKWDLLLGFLTKKGFSIDDMVAAGAITKKRTGSGFIDKYRGRVIFPLIDITGKVVGFTGRDIVGRDPKYLNTEETLVFHKSNYLYGLDKAKVAIKKDGAIFVEGQVDVLTAHQHNVPNVIASSGTALTSAQLKAISRYTNKITFCFDPDKAGITATARAIQLTEAFDFDILIAPVPDKYADLDEYIKNDEKAAFAALKNPIPIYDYFMAMAFKLYDKKTAYGKKEIVNYLVPILSKISNQITLDHYVKKLSEETSIGEDAIRNSIKTGVLPEELSKKPVSTTSYMPFQINKSPEHYLLTFLVKGNIDTISLVLYKLAIADFTLPDTIRLYGLLKDYLDSKPQRFDIQYFIETYAGDLKELVMDMYLWDLGLTETDQKAFASELEAAFSRVHTYTLKRELKNITEQIRLAELEKDSQKIKDLSNKFKALSEELI